MRSSVVLLATLAGLAGCGATTQLVAIRTVPEGANCTVARNGVVLGVVAPTPGRLSVGFSDRNLDVTCLKSGWQPATETVRAAYTGIGFGQLITGGPAAVVTDAVKSTDFRYDPNGVVIELTAN